MTLKAAIFDLDGVIFDSQEANVAFYNHLLAKVGLPPMHESSRPVVHSNSLDDSLRHLIADPALVAEVNRYWRTLDPTPFLAKLETFPHAVSTIRGLRDHLRLAVATNRNDTTRRALKHVGLDDVFEAVVTPTEAGTVKPDGRMMEVTLEMLGLSAEEVVYVGDSQVDEGMCLASGVRLIAFRNRELEAWAHLDDFRRLPGLLGI